MKKIDWGMVFPLFAFVVFIAFGLAVVGREFVRREIYIYDLGAPISWVAVLLHYTIIYLSVVGGFLSYQIIREISGRGAICFS